MGMTIGMAGKGGVGKTTVAGLAIKYLASKGRTPIWPWMLIPMPI